jgi:DNA-binding LacI/PurR family transcriptional regulator
MAIGALLAARRRGRHLPADLAVVGFDDIPGAAVVDPPLTTVAQPLAAVATQAVAFILSRLSGQTGPEPRRVVLTPTLVVRASCGAITVPPAA